MIRSRNRRGAAGRAFRTCQAISMFALMGPVTGNAVVRDDPIGSLVNAERDFAADAIRFGISPAFRAHAATDSILLRPYPMPAPELLARQTDDPGMRLEWQPAIAAIASSNDLGFTTGPYRMHYQGKEQHGQFLTIWQRDRTGRWRWFLDHGLPATSDRPLSPMPFRVARIGSDRASRKSAVSTFAAVEDVLNLALLARGEPALVDALAQDGYLLRAGRSPAGHADAAKLAATSPGIAAIERLGSRVSANDDFAVSYGRVVRPDAETAYHVRIWHRGPAGWRLLIDQLH